MYSVILCMCGVLFGVNASFLRINEERNCGVEASFNLVHHNPWLVFLEYFTGDTYHEIRCAGTLVDSRHVITAAHCIVKPPFDRLVARLGEYDLNSKVDCVQGVCTDPLVHIEVEDIVVHPCYDGRNNDIAILRLKEDAPYTDFIRPICLPSISPSEDSIFSAAGWGEIPLKGFYSHVKKIVPLPYWTRDNCEAAYQNFDSVPTTVICAGGQQGIDTCRGDSGGPLTLIREKVELAGVTSSGNTNCGTKDSPAFYTDVFMFKNWIREVISGKLTSTECDSKYKL